jgi:hypothetical protein
LGETDSCKKPEVKNLVTLSLKMSELYKKEGNYLASKVPFCELGTGIWFTKGFSFIIFVMVKGKCALMT